LTCASYCGHYAAVKALLEVGNADVNMTRQDGTTPLNLAAYADAKTALLLLDHGARPDSNTSKSSPFPVPLVMSAARGDVELCTRLIQVGGWMQAGTECCTIRLIFVYLPRVTNMLDVCAFWLAPAAYTASEIAGVSCCGCCLLAVYQLILLMLHIGQQQGIAWAGDEGAVALGFWHVHSLALTVIRFLETCSTSCM